MEIVVSGVHWPALFVTAAYVIERVRKNTGEVAFAFVQIPKLVSNSGSMRPGPDGIPA